LKYEKGDPNQEYLKTEATKLDPKHISISRASFSIANVELAFFFSLKVDAGVVLV